MGHHLESRAIAGIFLACCVTTMANGWAVYYDEPVPVKRGGSNCREVDKDPRYHAVLDKLCYDCQLMSDNSDFHYLCRSNCYDNRFFNDCWSFASGEAHRRKRSRPVILLRT